MGSSGLNEVFSTAPMSIRTAADEPRDHAPFQHSGPIMFMLDISPLCFHLQMATAGQHPESLVGPMCPTANRGRRALFERKTGRANPDRCHRQPGPPERTRRQRHHATRSVRLANSAFRLSDAPQLRLTPVMNFIDHGEAERTQEALGFVLRGRLRRPSLMALSR